MLSSFNCVQLFAVWWTIACQAPLSMGFSRQEYWSGLSSPPPGDLTHPGIQTTLPLVPPGKPKIAIQKIVNWSLTMVQGQFNRKKDSFFNNWCGYNCTVVFFCLFSLLAHAHSHVHLCKLMNSSLPGPPVHGILQARILEWVAIPFFRGSSQPRAQTLLLHLLHWEVVLYQLSHLMLSHFSRVRLCATP